jgi:hypothetical protein
MGVRMEGGGITQSRRAWKNHRQSHQHRAINNRGVGPELDGMENRPSTGISEERRSDGAVNQGLEVRLGEPSVLTYAFLMQRRHIHTHTAPCC